MERGKGNPSSRSQKKISAHAGSEFIALGTKGTDAKSKILSSTMDRKRESSSTAASVAKKPKLSSIRSNIEAMTAGGATQELWEQMASDCDSIDLIETVYTAMDQHDNETVVRLLCGVIKQLMSNARSKTDTILCFSLSYLAKLNPTIFCHEVVTSALISILRREVNMKNRQNTHSHILAANILARSYNDRQQWPEIFMRVYIDDAINERFWTDNNLCSAFIKNICSAFQTRQPSSSLLLIESGGPSTSAAIAAPSVQQHRETSISIDDDSGDNSIHGTDSTGSTRLGEPETGSDIPCEIYSRFSASQHIVEKYVIDAIKEQLNKRQQQDAYTRNFLKFLCTTSGLAEVRHLCISRLELWIHNGKLVKFAQQLLSYICFNIKGTCYKDHEVLALLVKMRLKTKPLINFYMACIKEMITLQPDILHIVLKLVVQNELSNTRNPNNMGMLAAMFQTAPEQAAAYLAEIYKEFLLQRDDCLRTLRVFLRELVRMLRYEMDIVRFCKSLLTERAELSKQIEQFEFRDRLFQSTVDIVCLCMLLCVSPHVRDATTSMRSNRDVICGPVLVKFYTEMSQIQLDAVLWMYETVPKVFKLQNPEYSQALHKLLLLEKPDQYSRCDQWPSESERATLLRTISETPIHEEALLRIILIGITKTIPFSIPETIDVIMMTISRASAMRTTNYSAVQANKFEIVDFLFNMAEYHLPENITLPAGYDPPKLAITVLYWKVFVIMLMISAHNPSSFGAFCWDHYPTMKMLIEMCITNQFNESVAPKDELQLLAMERAHILEFEAYLAAQTSQAIITEENSLLLSQVMLMDPMGPARRVPVGVLEQLKQMNKSLKLGHLLCRSRKPDLLLDIIQRQGTTQSMPWLSDLVQNSEGDFSHLPVQCLCEFLLFNASNINEENSRDAELVNFLRNLIIDRESVKQTVCEVLDYIFRRLSSTVKQSRVAALDGFQIIFKCMDAEENSWLLRCLPQTPHFREALPFIIPQLRSACQVENVPELVMAYIQFIAGHTINDPVSEMLDHVIDMAQLIVERCTMFKHIIPASDEATPPSTAEGSPSPDSANQENRFETLKCLFIMFNNYIIKLRENPEPYEHWTEYQDLVMVQFDDGVQLPLHLNIIHAFIILLTRSSNTMPESIPILDYWFPQDRPAPLAFTPSAPHEPVQLLPDWLKLKMIQSSVDRLVDAALRDLTPDQIVLFVQNFGIPVSSLSKLLALLDHAVIEQIEAVNAAILNRAYLAQLIEIQQARGAKNGHITVQALQLDSRVHAVPDPPKAVTQMLEPIDMSAMQRGEQSASALASSSSKASKDSDDLGQMILKNSSQSRLNDCRFRRLVHQMLMGYSNSSNAKTQANAPKRALNSLLRHLDRTKATNFYQNTTQKQHVCTLLRVLQTIKTTDDEESENVRKLIDELRKKVSEWDPPEAAKPSTSSSTSTSTSSLNFRSSFHGLLKTKQAAKVPPEETQIEAIPSEISLYNSRRFQVKCEGNRLVYKTVGSRAGQSEESQDPLSRDGLLVDWLADVDPELMIIRKKLKINFLFSKSCNEFRFYLLSLISHQTNWETLIATLNYLLQESDTDFDCPTVLNFIEALINNPKLWQGRDKYVSKSNQPEVVLSLNASQLDAFATFILREGESELEIAPAKYDFKLCSRINLLFKLINRKGKDLVHFVECILSKSYPEKIKFKVLQQIYLMYPSIKFLKVQRQDEFNSKVQSLKGCSADKVTNYLLTCLGSLVTKKDSEALSGDTELLMRKLAASHPALFLRQLGVLSSLLQGRAQMNFRALREENHLQRFIQLLRALELLQPLLFDDTYKSDFQAIMDCYFKFFKHHSCVREAYHILIKFVELLQLYINENPTSALLFLEQYVGILNELSMKFHSVAPLHQLVQGISLLQRKTMASNELSDEESKQEFDLDEKPETKPPAALAGAVTSSDMEVIEAASAISAGSSTLDINNRGAISFAISNTPNRFTTVSPHFLNLIKIVRDASTEDAILGPLQEIESLTSKRFSFLSELFDRLLELIFSPSAQIRSNAYILLIRHLKHNPGRPAINRSTLNSYVQCLRDDNSSVAATAVDNLAEITLLLQEHAVEILCVAFSLGIRSRLNTGPQIKRVLQTLTLQHGY